jgi:hypothetical protein
MGLFLWWLNGGPAWSSVATVSVTTVSATTVFLDPPFSQKNQNGGYGGFGGNGDGENGGFGGNGDGENGGRARRTVGSRTSPAPLLDRS